MPRNHYKSLIISNIVKKLVRLVGFEPTTSGATNQRSNQLSYNRIINVLIGVHYLVNTLLF